MDNSFFKNITWYKLLVAFSITSFLLIVIGYIVYDDQKSKLKQEVYNELSQAARKNVNDILLWLNERESDAQLIYENKIIKPYFFELVNNPNNPKNKEQIKLWLHPIMEYHDYDNAYILNSKGKLIYSYITSNLQKKEQLFDLQYLTKSKIFRTDLIINSENNKAHMDYFIPLSINMNNRKINLGVLVLRINPYKSFFKLVNSLPLNYKSKESYLVRREGDYAVRMSQIKNDKLKSFASKIHISLLDHPSVNAALGKEGIFEGNDYRGIQVLSDIRKIPNTSWFIVSKVDKAEIYSRTYNAALIIFFVVFFLIILLYVSNIWIWQYFKNKSEKEILLTKLRKKSFEKYLDHLGNFTKEIFFLFDLDLKIVFCNKSAEEAYGFSHDELMSLSLSDIKYNF